MTRLALPVCLITALAVVVAVAPPSKASVAQLEQELDALLVTLQDTHPAAWAAATADTSASYKDDTGLVQDVVP